MQAYELANNFNVTTMEALDLIKAGYCDVRSDEQAAQLLCHTVVNAKLPKAALREKDMSLHVVRIASKYGECDWATDNFCISHTLGMNYKNERSIYNESKYEMLVCQIVKKLLSRGESFQSAFLATDSLLGAVDSTLRESIYRGYYFSLAKSLDVGFIRFLETEVTVPANLSREIDKWFEDRQLDKIVQNVAVSGVKTLPVMRKVYEVWVILIIYLFLMIALTLSLKLYLLCVLAFIGFVSGAVGLYMFLTYNEQGTLRWMLYTLVGAVCVIIVSASFLPLMLF